jgi:hypothetical protein
MSGNPVAVRDASGPDGDIAWFDERWQPRSLRPERPRLLGGRWRIGVLVLVVLLHLAGAYWLTRWADHPADARPGSLRVEFVFELPAETIVELPPLPETPRTHEAAPPRPQPRPPARPASPSARPSAPRPSTARPRTSMPSIQLQLYDETGRVRIDKETLDALDKQFGEKRTFSYQIPRMGDAEKLLTRPQLVTYEPTRFADMYRPTRNILDDVLERAVEATTAEVRIPVPGHPESKMVCKIQILAMGGGCGILTNGADYVGPVDDPDTLSEEEDRQCQAWYEQIVGATTQDAWRATRKLYDASCRKPRERKPTG